jgi:serine/threonine protein kinase
MTFGIAAIYHECDMKYSLQHQHQVSAKRILTRLAEGVRNDGYDNEDSDYICRVGDIICSPEGLGYEIIDKLGHGTFGQVMKCTSSITGGSSGAVAIKIIKNKSAYFKQGLVEVRILDALNKQYDLRIVKMLDYFVFRKHLCIVFELLSVNLYDVIKNNSFRGMPFLMVQSMIDQLARCLVCLRASDVIHSDLKPENILLLNRRNTKIKLIDFGSAAFTGQQVYTYIQSRFYRSVDVILGIFPFTTAIDMWSLGCILVELFTGMPVFPGQSEYDQLTKIVELLGPIPSQVLDRGKHTRKFYSKTSSSEHRFRSKEEYEQITNKTEKPRRKHVRANSLRELIMNTPYHKDDKPCAEETARREKIVHFASLCLEYDPEKRLTPAQAVTHPLFDDSVSLADWTAKSDKLCMKRLSEDPNSFLNNSTSVKPMDSSGISMAEVNTPIKQFGTPGGAQSNPPLQPRNAQSMVQLSTSKNTPVDDYYNTQSISYRPQIHESSAGTPYKIQQSAASPHSNLPPIHAASPRIIQNHNNAVRLPPGGGIPFSPAKLMFDTSPPSNATRGRSHSDAQLFVSR